MRFLNKTKAAVTAILLSVSSQAFADIVKGTVLDETGEAAIGVSVTVKDTKIAAVTDLDGNYTIDVPKKSDKLIFNYVGC